MPKTKAPYHYDAKKRRWVNQDNLVIPKRTVELWKARQSSKNEDEGAEFGFSVPKVFSSPKSDLYARVENLIGRAERGQDISNDPAMLEAGKRFGDLVGLSDPDVMTAEINGKMVVAAEVETDTVKYPPQPIPAGIRAAMNSAEYYCNTEGDVFQHIEAPIDVSVSELEINVPGDKKLDRMLKELYAPDKLDMISVLTQIWMTTATYGSAYPLEIPSAKEDGAPVEKIVMLPSKFVWVGYHITNSDGADTPYMLRPLNGAPNWSEGLLRQTMMPMTYNAFATGFNEQIVQGWGLPLNPSYLHPVRGKAFDWNRYPLPPISRAFRAISTRAIYQEMRRALLEGYKNQLWVFILGSKELPPSPKEMAALRGAVSGLSGNRTGDLVWRYPLDVQVKVPASFDNAVGNETSQAFTLEIFRNLGSNIQITTGNKVYLPGSSGDSGVEVDLTIWLRRMEFVRNTVLRWEQGFRNRLADRMGAPKLKEARVSFSKSLLEISEKIKKEIVPMYSAGLYSPQTALAATGKEYDIEIDLKKAAQKDAELLMPPATYNQTTMGPGGEKSVANTPKGRPETPKNPNVVKAAWEDDAERKEYFGAIEELLASLVKNGKPEEFISNLKATNSFYLDDVTRKAYRESGGVGAVPAEWQELAANFVNAYADNFLNDLKASDPVEFSSDRNAWRTMLYPQEGYKMAVLNGQGYAMKQQGASHWRRVIHPEKSEAGTCSACLADASITHSIDEPFQVLHPNENCGRQELYLQYFVGNIPSIEMPVPSFRSDVADDVEESLGKANSRTRRRRV